MGGGAARRESASRGEGERERESEKKRRSRNRDKKKLDSLFFQRVFKEGALLFCKRFSFRLLFLFFFLFSLYRERPAARVP